MCVCVSYIIYVYRWMHTHTRSYIGYNLCDYIYMCVECNRIFDIWRYLYKCIVLIERECVMYNTSSLRRIHTRKIM